MKTLNKILLIIAFLFSANAFAEKQPEKETVKIAKIQKTETNNSIQKLDAKITVVFVDQSLKAVEKIIFSNSEEAFANTEFTKLLRKSDLIVKTEDTYTFMLN
jgi:hypothetical protein